MQGLATPARRFLRFRAPPLVTSLLVVSFAQPTYPFSFGGAASGFIRQVRRLPERTRPTCVKPPGMSTPLPETEGARIHKADTWDARMEEATLDSSADRVHVILDFDRTITAFTGKNGGPSDECHEILFRHPKQSDKNLKEVDDFWVRARETFGVMHMKSEEEQKVLFDDWWREANNLILRHGIEEAHVALAVQRANTLPRDGALELMRKCVERDIPVLIVSAGFTQVITEFVRQHDPALAASPLLSIHANHMVFDSGGTLAAFGEQVVHAKNKRFLYNHIGGYFDKLRAAGRDRPLILGDSLGDAEVTMHVPHGGGGAGLKIGFANKADADIPRFLSVFDAVLTGDQSFAFVDEVLDVLTGAKQGILNNP
ncbi:pyrimidine 5'-nucleotidase-domain-containing protein [Baffinella frigidus]|nr:pyrimidine 5'-nucleotidase-domain-containing protein [Cryptophyta sp. CCMP2293]